MYSMAGPSSMKIRDLNLGLYTVLALALTAFCIWQNAQWSKNPVEWQNHNRSTYYAPRESAWKLHLIASSETLTNQEAVAKLQDRLASVFDKRFEQYKSNLESLNENLWHQLILITAALVLILKKSNSFKVPVIDMEVPVRWTCWAIPICLGYLWIRFGFVLNELIDARIVLWKTADAMQAPVEAFGAVKDWRRALYTFSYDPSVYDNGYLDGYFISFLPDFTLLGRAQTTTPAVLVALFGVFLGISNGTMLGFIMHGAKRFGKSKQWPYFIFFWFLGIMLFLTHWTFWYGGQHPNWWQPIIAIVGCFVAILLGVMPIYNAAVTPQHHHSPTG